MTHITEEGLGPGVVTAVGELSQDEEGVLSYTYLFNIKIYTDQMKLAYFDQSCTISRKNVNIFLIKLAVTTRTGVWQTFQYNFDNIKFDTNLYISL